MKKLLITTALVIAFMPLNMKSKNAWAQDREYRSGLNYTTMGRSAKNATPAKATSELAKENTDTAITELKETSTKEEGDEISRVWKKYQALATGTSKDEEEKAASVDKPVKPDVEKPTLTKTANEQAAPKQQNAFGAILEEWKNTKEDRRDMRSMSFGKPANTEENADKDEAKETPEKPSEDAP